VLGNKTFYEVVLLSVLSRFVFETETKRYERGKWSVLSVPEFILSTPQFLDITLSAYLNKVKPVSDGI
jgi:hypothetical protein